MTRGVIDDFHDLAEVSRRFFDCDDIWELRQTQDRLGLDISARPSRDVVDDYRNILRLRNRLEMFVIPLLSRLVVVRSNRENAISAQSFRAFCCLYRFPRGIAAGSRDHRNPPMRLFNDNLDDAIGFIPIESGAFARCTAGQQHVDAAIDLELNEPGQSLLVNRPIALERREHCGSRSLKWLLRHVFSYSSTSSIV